MAASTTPSVQKVAQAAKGAKKPVKKPTKKASTAGSNSSTGSQTRRKGKKAPFSSKSTREDVTAKVIKVITNLMGTVAAGLKTIRDKDVAKYRDTNFSKYCKVVNKVVGVLASQAKEVKRITGSAITRLCAIANGGKSEIAVKRRAGCRKSKVAEASKFEYPTLLSAGKKKAPSSKASSAGSEGSAAAKKKAAPKKKTPAKKPAKKAPSKASTSGSEGSAAAKKKAAPKKKTPAKKAPSKTSTSGSEASAGKKAAAKKAAPKKRTVAK